eukprot:g190.t1
MGCEWPSSGGASDPGSAAGGVRSGLPGVLPPLPLPAACVSSGAPLLESKGGTLMRSGPSSGLDMSEPRELDPESRFEERPSRLDRIAETEESSPLSRSGRSSGMDILSSLGSTPTILSGGKST